MTLAQQQNPQSKLIWLNEHTAKHAMPNTTFPSDNMAEATVLGAILAAGAAGNGNQAVRRVPFLRPEDFWIARHGVMYRAMLEIMARGDQVDAVSVTAALRARTSSSGQTALEYAGGELYIDKLATNAVANNLETYARIVVRNALYRATMVAGNTLHKLGQGGDLEMDTLAAEIQGAIRDINVRLFALTEHNTVNLPDAFEQYLEKVRRELADENFEPGIDTGYQVLTRKLLGWRNGKLYIVAAPSGMGKSALLLDSALKALTQSRKRVLFITLEMQIDEVLDRIICNLAGIDGDRYQSRNLRADEITRIETALAEVMALEESKKFQIVCMNYPTMAQIRAKLDELQLNPGYDIVFVDYAGIETIAYEGRTRNSEYLGGTEHANAIWTNFRSMKLEYNVPFVVASQINSNYSKRKDKRPLLTDLSNSSLSSKGADVVMFLHREAKFDDMDEYDDRAEIIVAKNRSGRDTSRDTIYLRYEDTFTRFSDWVLPQYRADEGNRVDLSDL